MTMTEFNPASDLPTTTEQLEQVRAVAIAEFEWDTIGGPMIDSILKREANLSDAAMTLNERYGATRAFWQLHLASVLEDNGATLALCPICGARPNSCGHACNQRPMSIPKRPSRQP